MLREGLHYALRKPTIVWPATMWAFISVFALSTPVLMAAFADQVFYTGAQGFGLLSTLIGAGALAGAISSARRRVPRLRTVIFSAFSFGLTLALSAFAASLPIFGAVMVLAGFCSMLFVTSANQLVQVSTEVSIRGRVMSLYIMVLVGGQAIGGPLIGALAEHLSPQSAIFISGIVPALAALAIAWVLARRGNLTLKTDLRRLPGVQVVTQQSDSDG